MKTNINKWVWIAGGIVAMLLIVVAVRGMKNAPAQVQDSSPQSPLEAQENDAPEEESACRDFEERVVEVEGGTRITVAMADQPAERALGLGGCEFLPEGAGMYFPYEEPQQTAYWMKGMVMPIDIVWIRNGRVVGVEENVQPPASVDVPDADLPHYTSAEPVDGVLEVAAGKAADYGLTVGAAVELE